MENRKRNLAYGFVGLICVILLTTFDQWTKHMAVLHLAGQEDIIIIPGVFQLQYLENKGAAFGMLQNQIPLFVILTGIYLCAAIWFYFKTPKKKKYALMHMICILLTAGAIGNFIDRIRLGYVVDFFYFSLINFPIFNVADIYVVVSFCVLILQFLFFKKDKIIIFVYKKDCQY